MNKGIEEGRKNKTDILRYFMEHEEASKSEIVKALGLSMPTVMRYANELISTSEFLIPLIEKWNAYSPVGRMGKPEELMSVCVYLAGDTSTFTTGSDFIVDGAFTCF